MKNKELSVERNMPGLVLSAVYSVRGRNLHELKIKKVFPAKDRCCVPHRMPRQLDRRRLSSFLIILSMNTQNLLILERKDVLSVPGCRILYNRRTW